MRWASAARWGWFFHLYLRGPVSCNPHNAPQAQLANPDSIAAAPDGSLYINSSDPSRVRKVDPSGIITTVAGGGTYYQSNCPQQTDQLGDGCPATQGDLRYNQSVAVGPDGSLYIVDSYHQRIRKVDLNGIISTVAGSGAVVNFCGDVQTTCVPGGFSGDGGPATQAQLNYPHDVAVGRDGSIYIDDTGNNRIRRVGPEGIITTLAGTGTDGFTPDGQPAMGSAINVDHGGSIAVGPDGSLYIWEIGNNVIRKVTPDGLLHTVAGNGNSLPIPPDGAPATSGGFDNPGGSRIAMGPDGTLYFSAFSYYRGCTVRQVTPDGIERAVAGSGCGFGGDTGPATQAQLQGPNGLAVAPDGSIYVADRQNVRVRRLTLPSPGFSIGDILIPSQDGSQVYRFNAGGRHLSTLNALTGAIVYQFGYDAAGRLSSITDGDGNVTTIDRDAGGNPLDIKGPYGQVTTLALDANGNLASVTDPADKATTFSYGPGALLTGAQGPVNDLYSFSYGDQGRLVKASDPAGGSITLLGTDTPTGRSVTATTGEGHSTTYLSSLLPSGVRRETVLYPDGAQTQEDSATNGTITTTAASGTVTTVTQGPDPRFGMQAPIHTAITVKTPGGLQSSTTASRTVSLTDPGNVLSLTNQTSSLTVNGKTLTSSYDAASRTYTTTTAMGKKYTTQVDAQQRPVLVQVPGLAPVSYTYDSHGRPATTTQGTGSTARTSTFGYGSDGYVASVTDASGRTVAITRDAVGRTLTSTLPGNRTITHTYDATGNLSTLTTPANQTHSFASTLTGQASSYTAPGSPSVSYNYNLDRQMKDAVRADGTHETFAYDSAGRIQTVTIPTGQISSTYDSTTGNLKSIGAPGGIGLAFSYDGVLGTGETWSGPVTGSVTDTFNNDFRLSGQSVAGGAAIPYTYDGDGQLASAGDLTITRDSQNGIATGSTLGAVATTEGYTPFGETGAYHASTSGTTLLDQQYTRDAVGRVLQTVESIGGSTDTYSYGYDTAQRLASVKKNGTTIASYSYDANGNRLTATDSAGSFTGAYDSQDRLIKYGNTSYTYNPNGERTQRTNGTATTTYSYDALGNLTGVTKPDGTAITYLVDGRNRRIGKQVNGTLVQGFLYGDGLKPVAELDGSNALVSRFVYTGGGTPAYLIKGGVEYRIITDQTGSVRLVVNSQTGAVVQRLDYDAFGRVLQDTNPGFQPFGFAGGLYDRDTGVAHFGAREYDPEVGRWLSKDPQHFAGGDTNLYGYVRNDPLNLNDPSGEGPHDGLLGFKRRVDDAYLDAYNSNAPDSVVQAAQDRSNQAMAVTIVTAEALVNTGTVVVTAIDILGPRPNFDAAAEHKVEDTALVAGSEAVIAHSDTEASILLREFEELEILEPIPMMVLHAHVHHIAHGGEGGGASGGEGGSAGPVDSGGQE